KSERLVASPDLVPGLPADPELGAEIGHPLTIAKPQHKTRFLIHGAAHFPGHGASSALPYSCYPSPRVISSPMYPGQTSAGPGVRSDRSGNPDSSAGLLPRKSAKSFR